MNCHNIGWYCISHPLQHIHLLAGSKVLNDFFIYTQKIPLSSRRIFWNHLLFITGKPGTEKTCQCPVSGSFTTTLFFRRNKWNYNHITLPSTGYTRSSSNPTCQHDCYNDGDKETDEVQARRSNHPRNPSDSFFFLCLFVRSCKQIRNHWNQNKGNQLQKQNTW